MAIIDSNCCLEKGRARRLLSEMDRCGVEKAVIGPSKNHLAVENKSGNSYIGEAIRKHPDRLIGFAVASPWYGMKAVRELERAHGLGLSGLKLNPGVQGVVLTDPQIHPLIDFAERAKWPVYCSTGTPVFSMPFQLAELAEKYPRVDFIMGHGGFSDFWYDVPDTLRRCPNIVLETSYVLPTQLNRWIEDCGIERFVFGSDHPFSSLELELRKIGLLKESIDRKLILGRNILRILGRSR